MVVVDSEVVVELGVLEVGYVVGVEDVVGVVVVVDGGVTLHGVTTASKAVKAIAPEPPWMNRSAYTAPVSFPLPLVANRADGARVVPLRVLRPPMSTSGADPKFHRVYRAWRSAAPVSLGGFQSLGTPATLITSGRSADGSAPWRNVMLPRWARSAALRFRTIWPGVPVGQTNASPPFQGESGP